MPHDLLETSWAEAIELELSIASIQVQQEENGWLLDANKAEQYLKALDLMMEERDNIIMFGVPPRLIKSREIASPYKKDGGLTVNEVNYWTGTPISPKGPYTRLHFEPINLGSEKQVKELLFSLGWEPDEWNSNDDGERTSPKLTEASLEALEGQVGTALRERFKCRHRRNQIAGFLKNMRPDGRIPSEANTIGTPTFRYTHRKIANIPKAVDYVFFGKEMRSLFTVPEGKLLVGGDLAGIEARLLAHYMNDAIFTDVLLNGDIHSYNQELAGLPTRDNAKTFFYAWLYGAGDAKIGSIIGGTASDGAEIKARFLSRLPALADLLKGVKKAAKARGYLYGLDRRKIYIRSEHAALNSLLQGGSSIVMKRVVSSLMNSISVENLDSKLVTVYHDEAQLECSKESHERTMELFKEITVQTGQWYKLNLPIKADVKVGTNWALTH